jgi:hypothetical protein
MFTLVLSLSVMTVKCNNKELMQSKSQHVNLIRVKDQRYEFCVVLAALNPLSCTAYKNTNPVNQRAEMKIDVDGSGPLRPFPVTCEFYGEHHTLYTNFGCL